MGRRNRRLAHRPPQPKARKAPPEGMAAWVLGTSTLPGFFLNPARPAANNLTGRATKPPSAFFPTRSWKVERGQHTMKKYALWTLAVVAGLVAVGYLGGS